ncbi:tyrosine--tRNA ligase [Salsipaludibacter albus]|uniref:tyrosine--tRNA ligase n=1 Tax=Salsipaludibacter albus TaxID=2849650 RepID=UPI001EE494E2|nr:tyrosine--tRNA ligase [Salsipaludibacter albus]MBY5163096.1 tyrosine--tRNA ligase [Salsipaludibacter albus]
MTHVLDTLRSRGFVADVTDEAGLRDLLASERVTFYVGFDPTAPSLHAGSLVGMMAMAHLQRAGHRPIALAGGATGRIGDPTGRDAEREVVDEAQLAANLAGIREHLSLVLDLEGDAGKLVDNYSWTGPMSFLEFLGRVGAHVPVTQMLGRESVKRRLDSGGLTYAEFSYQLLQAHDFAHLYEAEGCRLQGGGSDQWGNITAGIDLARRMHGAQVYGLTWPLLLTADGKKFGKSAGNAVWLDPELTSPYGYYQYFVNATDDDVVAWLKLFTFLPLDEIEEVAREHERDPSARSAQRVLAREATRIVHGDAGVEAAEAATAVLFGDESFVGMDDAVLADAFAEAPSVEVGRADLDTGIGLLNLLTEVGATSSNSQARQQVSQGAVRLNNEVVTDHRRQLTTDDLASPTTLVLRVGKRRYFLARVREDA